MCYIIFSISIWRFEGNESYIEDTDISIQLIRECY